MNMSGLGNFFNKYRTKYRITLREISQETGILISKLSDLEHGRELFTPEIVRRIQSAINPKETFLIDEFQKYCGENSSKAEIDGQEVDIVIFVVYGDAIALIRDNDILEIMIFLWKVI